MVRPLRRLPSWLLVAGALVPPALGSRPTAPPPAADLGGGKARPAWTLVWRDEFGGAAGAPVDAAKWVADTGGQDWGNRERQYYTAGSANAALDGAGRLVITARAEPRRSPLRCWYGRCQYASARLKTSGRFQVTYGRVEARIRLPRGRGLWPAFWMLGADCDRVGWPTCGEIDVMESVGQKPDVVLGTLHGPGYSGAHGISKKYASPAASFSDDFHVFAVEWSSDRIRWLVDDREYHRVTPADLPAGAPWVFDHPFFLLLNVAVGGGLPGDPDASTTFPQQMVVDYVRVYRQRD